VPGSAKLTSARRAQVVGSESVPPVRVGIVRGDVGRLDDEIADLLAAPAEIAIRTF
jgi:hypothetical protein